MRNVGAAGGAEAEPVEPAAKLGRVAAAKVEQRAGFAFAVLDAAVRERRVEPLDHRYQRPDLFGGHPVSFCDVFQREKPCGHRRAVFGEMSPSGVRAVHEPVCVACMDGDEGRGVPVSVQGRAS